MKYIVLSFDDGRKDFYTRALPILKKYRLTATLNVISNFVEKNDMSNFGSENGSFVSWEQIRECREYGVEIANHSAKHSNKLGDIVQGKESLQLHLSNCEHVGFASPFSGICAKNFNKYRTLLDDNSVSYIRSGNQLKRDGLFYAFLFLLYKYTHSKAFFWLYNKRNIIKLQNKSYDFFPSVTCNKENTPEQVVDFIKKMPQDTAVILMFHSILEKDDRGYGKDKWFNTVSDFERICRFLSEQQGISVITNDMLCKLIKSQA